MSASVSRLVLETGADVGVVDGERGGVAEALREEELLVGERGLLADAIDVEGPLQLPARDERHGDERLRLDRRAGDEADARVEVRLVREDRLAMVDCPAGDPLAERERLAHDLVGPFAAREDGAELALRLVRLVDVHVLVRDEHGERVGDTLEERAEALLGEDVVEDLGEPPVGLGRAARDEADLRPGIRIDGCRVGHAASELIGRRRSPLESPLRRSLGHGESRHVAAASACRMNGAVGFGVFSVGGDEPRVGFRVGHGVLDLAAHGLGAVFEAPP